MWRSCRARPRRIDSRWKPNWRLTSCGSVSCAWTPQRGKRSLTVFEVRERFSGFTLLQCEPLTNRPHQIRAHLRWARLPVVGDRAYGGRPLLLSSLKREYRLKPNQIERPLIARAALHAESLTLPHPVTGEALTITAPWPKDLTVAVKYLRRYAAA